MLVSQEKERKLHQKLRSMDPMDIQRYFAAYILMKRMIVHEPRDGGEFQHAMHQNLR